MSDPAGASFRGRCPHCGRGKLFDGYLKVKRRCEVCGLDLSFADSGDGPAFFVMSITGFAAVAMVFALLYGFDLPAGAALIVGVVFSLLVTLATLRPAKGLLIGLQYKNDASEGQSR